MRRVLQARRRGRAGKPTRYAVIVRACRVLAQLRNPQRTEVLLPRPPTQSCGVFSGGERGTACTDTAEAKIVPGGRQRATVLGRWT
jgi:hypothetical protein